MPRTAWKTFIYAIDGQKILFTFICIFVISGNAIAFLVPYFLKLITDYAVATPTDMFKITEIMYPLIGVTAFLLMPEIAFRIAQVMEISATLRSFERITSYLYSSLLARPTAYFENRLSGELGRRIEQIGESVKYFIERLPWEVGWAGMGMVISTVLLSLAHPMLLVAFLVWFLLFAGSSIPLLRWQYQHSKKVAGEQAHVSGHVIDTLGNIAVVHTFAQERQESGSFKIALDALLKVDRRDRWIYLVNKAHQGTSIAALGIALILTSVYLFSEQQLTIGNFVLVIATLPSMVGIVWNIGDVILSAFRYFGNLVDAVADLQTENERLGEGSEAVDAAGDVIFKDLSFKYPGRTETIFSHFDLTIRSGERVGIVGSSGAGKSTLVKLILRQYDPTEGQLTIGGTDLKNAQLKEVRERIAFVPQDTALFHRTLFDNIRYAKPEASPEEIMSASKESHAHDFIMAMPLQYETKVGERGVKLSGGQRQRVAIARAMLKNAPILVLDEATSALDSESEEIVQEGLHKLFHGRTVIAIAHRLSTLREMDRIIVLEEGKIAEDGSPQTLLAKEGVFKRMWEHQKGGFVG